MNGLPKDKYGLPEDKYGLPKDKYGLPEDFDEADFVFARYGLPEDDSAKLKLSKVPTGSVKYCRQPGGAGEENGGYWLGAVGGSCSLLDLRQFIDTVK